MGKEQGKVIEVRCADPGCRQEIARYNKIPGTGALLKMYIDEVRKDRAGIFNPDNLKNVQPGTYNFICPGCNARIGVLARIHGRLAMDIDQGKLFPRRV